VTCCNIHDYINFLIEGFFHVSHQTSSVKTLGKVVGAFGTVAFATTGVPSAAVAAKKVVEVVDTAITTKQIITGVAMAGVAGAAAYKPF
jgi:hypothetical protein